MFTKYYSFNENNSVDNTDIIENILSREDSVSMYELLETLKQVNSDLQCGPDNKSESDFKLYELLMNETSCHQIHVDNDNITYVEAYHSYHNKRQMYSVQIWPSDQKAGMTLDSVNDNYKDYHLTKRPVKYAFYTIEGLVERNGPRPKVLIIENSIMVPVPEPGFYYMNFTNKIGRDNQYGMKFYKQSFFEL